jgi:hypothetical protein
MVLYYLVGYYRIFGGATVAGEEKPRECSGLMSISPEPKRRG